MSTRETTPPAPPQPKFERVVIEATPNGYIVLHLDSQGRYPDRCIGSFESFASLTQWLKKNLVPR